MARKTAGASLREYKKKRNFRRTAEPAGAAQTNKRRGRTVKRRDPTFVIQMHAARALHYDFRLEVDGVLKSWAVPKGPSTDPAVKRLAMQVEDHPLEYGGFEGNIPLGEYGGGTVIVWDKGTYRNMKTDKDGSPMPMDQAMAKGTVEIWLEGQKIRGGYALIRTFARGGRQAWLLIKMKDDGADPKRDLTADQPQSVVSGKTLRQVAEASGSVPHVRRLRPAIR